MKSVQSILILSLLVAMTMTAYAAETIIPKGTVIPVTIDRELNSATSKAGSTFYATSDGTNTAGFPDDTQFAGTIESVTKASGKDAGEINVGFVGAKLPNGSRIALQGQPISLDDKSVKVDESTGRLVGTDGGKENPTKFIAIGAGAGLLIGQVLDKKPLIGTIVGAAAGYLYGQQQAKSAEGKNVSVPAGTRFGILLGQDVTIPDTWTASTASWNAPESDTGDGLRVTFAREKPMMIGNNLMVPFRSVMQSIDIPFDYNATIKQVRVNENGSQYTHAIGTRVVDVDGADTALNAASRTINGTLYVPVSYFELLTNKTANWNRQSGVLRLQ